MDMRTAFLQSLQDKLSTSRIVWLKATTEKLTDTPANSDVDLLLPKSEVKSLISWIERKDAIERLDIVRKSYGHHLRLYFANFEFLQIDLLFSLSRKAIAYFNTQDASFKKNIFIRNGVRVQSPELLFEHVFLFNILNHAEIPARYWLYLKTHATDWKTSLRNIEAKYGLHERALCSMEKDLPGIRKSVLRYLKSKPENSKINRLIRFKNNVLDALRSKSKASGFIISLSGVDGAGKTTILKALQEKLTKKYRRNVVVLRHRPGILPILSAIRYGKKKAEKKSVERLPRTGNNTNVPLSILRFCWYYIDYLIGQFWVYLKFVHQGTVVIYDRYYFDFMADPKRSNLNLPKTISSLGSQFVIFPKYNYLLVATPETILQRKQELSKEDILEMTKNYSVVFKELARKKKNHFGILNNTVLKNTLERIEHHIVPSI